MRNDYSHIEELIRKFFDGKSSNAEEKELYDFFSREEIPESLSRHRNMFLFFNNDFNCALRNHQDSYPVICRKRKHIKYSNIISGIAASAIIVMVMITYLFSGYNNDFNVNERNYIIKNGVKSYDPDLIEKEKNEIMAFISRKREDSYNIYKLSKLKEEETKSIMRQKYNNN